MKFCKNKLLPLILTLSNSVSAGLLSNDIPKEVMENKSTEKLFFSINKPLNEATEKFQRMRALCGGNGSHIEESITSQNAIFVSWISKSDILYIIEFQKNEKTTNAIVYMNNIAFRQKKGWPLIFDEWFIKDGNSCISEIMKRS